MVDAPPESSGEEPPHFRRAWLARIGSSIAVKIVAPSLFAAAALLIAVIMFGMAMQDQRDEAEAERRLIAEKVELVATLPQTLGLVQAELYKYSVWSFLDAPTRELGMVQIRTVLLLKKAEASVNALGADGLIDVAPLTKRLNHYERAVGQALKLIGRSPMIGATATKGLERLFEGVLSEASRTAEAAQAAFDVRAQASAAEARARSRSFAIGAVVSVGLISAFAIFVAVGVARPLGQLFHSLRKLQDGERAPPIRFAGRNDEIGAVGRAIGAFADALQARDRLESRLKEQRIEALALARRAEEAAVAKSAFLATMSHEIRTPMNGVTGMLTLMLADTLPENQRERAEIARASSVQLLDVLNDVLDLSKMEAGAVEVEAEPVNVAQIARDVLSLLSVNAAQIETRVDVAPGAPDFVVADQMRLRQILFNLCGNAIKFTASGEVVVRLSWRGEDARGLEGDASAPPDGGRLRVHVQDTGVGISEEAQQRLFKHFSQVDGSVTREYGGTGLGLAISKQLVELMGGTVGVASVEGSGSTFWFEIPTVATSGAATDAASDAAAAATTETATGAAASGAEMKAEEMIGASAPAAQDHGAIALRKFG